MARYKPETKKMLASVAIGEFYAEVEDLANDIRDIVDNASEGLSQTQRIQTLSETADALEECQAPDEPGDGFEAVDPEVTVVNMLRGGKKRGSESRSVRASNAAGMAKVAVEALREWMEEQEANLNERKEAREAKPKTEGEVEAKDVVEDDDDDKLEALLDEIRSYCDEVEEHAEQVENAEFPGMYG